MKITYGAEEESKDELILKSKCVLFLSSMGFQINKQCTAYYRVLSLLNILQACRIPS